MKIIFFILVLMGVATHSLAQSPTPTPLPKALNAAPKGVPSNEDPLRELKSSKKKTTGNNHRVAKDKVKKKKHK